MSDLIQPDPPEQKSAVTPAPASPVFRHPTQSKVLSDGLRDADLHHPSAMVEQLGLFLRLFSWIFFKPVQFAPRLHNELAAHAREGVIVYMMNTTSLLDYLYFNYALLGAKLPLSTFSNGLSLTVFQPWRRALVSWFRRRILQIAQVPEVDVMRAQLRRSRPILLFLRRAYSLLDLINPPADIAYLRELIEAQREGQVRLLVVPQVLVWHRDPDKSRSSIIDEFFGDPEAPGRIRKRFSFLLNHRRAFVQVAEPIDLQKFVADHPASIDDGLLAEKLSYTVIQSFKTEHRVIRGAPIKPPQQIREEILQDNEVQIELQELAVKTAKPLADVVAEAAANLDEISANFKMNMLSALSICLTLLWARIYEGIEVDEPGLERIREVGRKSPVVVVPSHKSHIDYLIISWLFYQKGLIPPHIAAGANLSFFPLGWVFRRAGAFFLRRTFHGQPIYAAIFRQYMRKLLKEGMWLEFFLEGGRSRTGKLLPPKYGLLKHVLEAVSDGTVADVALVPTNFGYERLIEEKAYRKELEGGEKKAESPVEVLKATSVLVHKYGRIRIQFGQPLSVRQILGQYEALDAKSPNYAGNFERALKVCGYQILGGINAASVITPTSIVSAVLLTKIQRGISRDDLLVRVGYLLDIASRRGAVLSDPLVTAMRTRRQQLQTAEVKDAHRHAASGGIPDPFGAQSERARIMGESVAGIVDKVLALFESTQWLVCRDFDDQHVYITKKAGRLHLDYYKNNMIHLFVPDAMLAASVLALREEHEILQADELQDMTKFLSRLLKFEFVYAPGLSFEEQYSGTLRDFCAAGWLVQHTPGTFRLRTTVTPVVRLYANLIQNVIHSYALMGRSLIVLEKNALSESAFLDHVQTEAAMAFELGDVQCYESISKVNLGNALKIFLEQKFVRTYHEGTGKKRVKMLSAKRGEGTGAQLAGYVQRIRSLHAPWRLDK